MRRRKRQRRPCAGNAPPVGAPHFLLIGQLVVALADIGEINVISDQ